MVHDLYGTYFRQASDVARSMASNNNTGTLVADKKADTIYIQSATSHALSKKVIPVSVVRRQPGARPFIQVERSLPSVPAAGKTRFCVKLVRVLHQPASTAGWPRGIGYGVALDPHFRLIPLGPPYQGCHSHVRRALLLFQRSKWVIIWPNWIQDEGKDDQGSRQ